MLRRRERRPRMGVASAADHDQDKRRDEAALRRSKVLGAWGLGGGGGHISDVFLVLYGRSTGRRRSPRARRLSRPAAPVPAAADCSWDETWAHGAWAKSHIHVQERHDSRAKRERERAALGYLREFTHEFTT